MGNAFAHIGGIIVPILYNLKLVSQYHASLGHKDNPVNTATIVKARVTVTLIYVCFTVITYKKRNITTLVLKGHCKVASH